MKKALFSINVLYIFLVVSGSIYGIGEKTVSLGGASSWKNAEYRVGVTEVSSVRPYPVLVLSSASNPSAPGYQAASGVSGLFAEMTEPAIDMALSFDNAVFMDSAGNYRVTISDGISNVDRRFARAGTGAALFGGDDIYSGNKNSFTGGFDRPLVIEPSSANALFSPGKRIGDFTFEFWIYPFSFENGQQILSWSSSRPENGKLVVPQVICVASKNRLQWSFLNFFTSPAGRANINIEFSGTSHIVPKTWSHHLVRFDATTGMIEYVVNGAGETIVYATSSGRESSEVYTPIAGNDSAFVIGQNFSGYMDELKIHSACAGRNSIQKYAPSGGRAATRAVDLGENNSGVLKVEASGGRTSIVGTKISNEFRENGRFRFKDDSEIHFFIRAANNPYLLNEKEWVNFIPGAQLPGSVTGRYVQFAFDFYPSSDGESSPYLDEVRIVYLPGEPPLPPRNLTAVAFDGGVQLRWKPSPDINAAGYLVYYSSVRGELFGKESSLGASPVDAGKNSSLQIKGLKNGALYYFRIAAYEISPDSGALNVGEFSKEVTARPLQGLTLESSIFNASGNR